MKVYYPAQSGWVTANLAVSWDALPAHAGEQEGSFEVLGHVLGTDLTTKMQVTVLTKGHQVLSENTSNNTGDSKAFASTTNDIQAASHDRIFYINDGQLNEDGRWTNWSRTPKDQETSVGILFKKNGQIISQTVGEVAIQFFRDSGTDAPANLVLERYVGPAYSEPSTISRYEEDSTHPFNKSENWTAIPYQASGEIVAGKPITFTFDPIQTTAIRARMTRKPTTNGLAVVEFTAYSPRKVEDTVTPTVAISVAGKALEHFDPAVTDYTLDVNGARPQVTVQTTGHGVASVIASTKDDLPTLVRLLSQDGSLVKEYHLHFQTHHQSTPLEGDQSLVVDRPSLEVKKTPIAYEEVMRENPELPIGQRRVLVEGKNGEKVDYFAVLGSKRTLVHTETTPVQNRIIEIGVKPLVTSSKGEEPAPVLEVPAFEGGVNGEEAAVHDLPAYTEPFGTAGEQAAPVLEVPEFKGGVNAVEAAVHDLPAYTEPFGTVGEQAAPILEVPEFKGGVNAVEAAVHDLPAYTGPLGTVGNEVAPEPDQPRKDVRVLADKATGVWVAGLSDDLAANLKLQVQKVLRQDLAGTPYDAYHLALLDHDNHVVTPKGALLVHLPIKGQLKAVYAMNLDQTLTEQNVKVVGDSLEFASKDLGLYVIVYQASSSEMVPTNQTLSESLKQGEKEVKTGTSENPASLPKTGDTRSTALFLESLGLLFAAYFLLKKGKEDKTS